MSSIASFTPLVENPYSWKYKAKKVIAPVTEEVVSLTSVAISRYLQSPYSLCGYLACGISAGFAAKHFYDWYFSVPTPAESISPEFYDELEKKNNDKNTETRLALLEISESDHNGALSSLLMQASLLQIAKNQRLAIRTVRKVDDIGRMIDEVSNEQRRQIDSLYILGHGNPELIQLGRGEERPYIYTLDEDHHKHFRKMVGRKVYFISCSTGAGLALRVAREAHIHIWAPLTTAYPVTLIAYPCQDHVSDMNFSLVDKWNEWPDMDGRQDVRIFHPDGDPTEPCDLKTIQEAFVEKIAFLQKKSLAGDGTALFELGLLYLQNRRYIKDADANAEQCFYVLNKNGCPQAAYELGCIYCSTDRKEAGIWLIMLVAEKYNYSDALCFLGRFHERREIATARNYYIRAKNLGHPEAAYRLGLIYKGRNEFYDIPDPIDQDRAITCFCKAASNGHAHASYELAHICKDSCPQEAYILFKEFNNRYKAVYFKDHRELNDFVDAAQGKKHRKLCLIL